VNNDLVAGYDGHAGLVSHLPIAEGGPLCTRGHRGCASAYLSSGAIVRSLSGAYDHHQAGFEDGLQAARMRSPAALRVFTDACFALGALTGYVANLVGPDRVVLSGEGIGMCEVAPEALQAGMARHLHWNAAPFELDIHPFAFDEWARGAAAVAIQSLVRPRGTVAA
jgi:predicted NBD/HSP70 family sugar kinase